MEPSLFDAAACGLIRTNDAGTILLVNRTFCGWLGYEPEALIQQRRLQDLFTVGGRIFHQTHWAPLLQMQGSISEVKLEVAHRDGSRMPMVLNAVRRLHEGAFVHDVAAFVARDRDKYELELLRSRKRLEELVEESTRLKDMASDRALLAEQMIGIVSHDLRNPLSTIALGTALLARESLPDSQQRTLGRITRATERANRLIGDLLDFTQARTGKALNVALANLDLHDAVAHAVDELAPLYHGRELRHVRTGEGACAADANRLAQLVGNLVSNAMAYGKPSAPVTVTSRVEPAEFAIAVHNEGPAIPTDVQARIFQPLTRGTTSGSAARSIGLGLFIVSEIAKAHGGSAAVESAEGSGTTFTVRCPRLE